MGFFEDITLGRHAPGSSLIHRFDPRLKLLFFPVLIIFSFSTGSISRLCALSLFALLLLLLSRIEARIWLRGILALRWLFLSILLLHIFFSPGRTLFGTEWISLDGLIRGGMVCAQLALAVLFSSMLTLTTSPVELSSALTSIITPFRRFRFPVDDLSRHLLLVLHFIPILRDEGVTVAAQSPLLKKDRCRISPKERGKAIAAFLDRLLERLFDRADAMARDVASGKDFYDRPVPLRPFWPVSPSDAVALSLFSMIFFLLGILR